MELPAEVNHAVARSAHDIWALADDRVLHYDGRSWKNVSMKGAFPDRGGHPFLAGIATSKAGIWICADLDNPRPAETSLLLHHDGQRWTYERTEAKAGRWYPAENTPVADGAGGFWMRGSTDVNGYDSALVHRSAAGAWTRTPITVDRRPAEVHALVRLPGTSHLLAVGSYPSALPFADETGGVLSLARATL